MALQYGGRPVAWLGLGAPDAVSAGIAALQAALAQADTAASASAAVAALQAAGNAAATGLGPAIDASSGGNPDVMKVTQLAWQQNGSLAALDSGPSAAQGTVDAAKAIASQMVSYYQQAAKLAASKAGGGAPKPSGSTPAKPPSSGSAPAAPDAQPSSGLMDWVKAHQTPLAVGGAVVAGGAILAALLSASAPRHA